MSYMADVLFYFCSVVGKTFYATEDTEGHGKKKKIFMAFDPMSYMANVLFNFCSVVGKKPFLPRNTRKATEKKTENFEAFVL